MATNTFYSPEMMQTVRFIRSFTDKIVTVLFSLSELPPQMELLKEMKKHPEIYKKKKLTYQI